MKSDYKNLFYVLSLMALFISSAILLLIGYWMFWPVNVIDIENADSIKIDKSVYSPGDRIIYTFKYCKLMDVAGVINRSLVNSIRINYAAYHNAIPIGCGEFKNSDLIIPDFVDAGKYHLEATIEYEVNPIRTKLNHWSSVEFTIVK